jgi:predicted nucleic acid-binding protein
MAKFLLDTTALIDFSKGKEPTKSNITQLLISEEVGICAVNVAEFFTGLNQAQRIQWSEFFENLSYWEIDLETAKRAGVIRYDYLKKGKQLTTTDALIGATALKEKAVLITRNVKDFPMVEISIMES